MAEFQMILKERRRMCDSFRKCNDCPLGKAQPEIGSCKHWTVENPEETEKIVMQWSAEHPVMTNAMKFKEIFGYDFQDALIKYCNVEWLDEEYKKNE